MANKVTQTAGLIFNVNTVRNKLKEFYESQGTSTPMFSGGQSSVTAVLQKTLELILKECTKHVGKDKSGVRLVNRDFLLHSVLLHSGLKQYFSVQLDRFNQNQMYGDQVPISKADMEKVMESVDKDLSLTPKARNLACFLLLEVFIDMAHMCSQMLEFSKKKSLDARCVMYGVSSKFPDNIASELRGEIVRVAKAFGDELEDNSGSGDNAEEAKPVVAQQTAAPSEQDAGDDATTQEATSQTGKKKNAKNEVKTEVKTEATETKKPVGKKTTKQIDVEEEETVPEEPAEETVEAQPSKKPAVKTNTKPANTTVQKNNTKTVKGK